jgi:hypothetical protein
MGGYVPIGYEAAGRTLTINEAEAATIRTIYQRYLALRSVDVLKAELDRTDIRTKLRPGKSGRMKGGTRLSRGHLYRILSNPVYAGRIAHKGQVYGGQHDAIIDPETWTAVQALLRDNGHAHRIKAYAKNPSLLAGMIVDAASEKLVATHCVNQGRRFRYYVSASTIRSRRDPTQPPKPRRCGVCQRLSSSRWWWTSYAAIYATRTGCSIMSLNPAIASGSATPCSAARTCLPNSCPATIASRRGVSCSPSWTGSRLAMPELRSRCCRGFYGVPEPNNHHPRAGTASTDHSSSSSRQ